MDFLSTKFVLVFSVCTKQFQWYILWISIITISVGFTQTRRQHRFKIKYVNTQFWTIWNLIYIRNDVRVHTKTLSQSWYNSSSPNGSEGSHESPIHHQDWQYANIHIDLCFLPHKECLPCSWCMCQNAATRFFSYKVLLQKVKSINLVWFHVFFQTGMQNKFQYRGTLLWAFVIKWLSIVDP